MARKQSKKTSKQILEGVTSGKKALQNPNVVEKKNRRDLSSNTRGPKPLMEQEVYQTIDWMKQGQSTQWCTDMLKQTINQKTGRVYAPRFVENIITAANQLIEMYYRAQIYQVEQLHVTRYNQIIVDLLNKKYEFNEEMPEWLRIKLIADDLNDVLQSLKQKETLLGMHRKTFKLTINTQNNINFGQPKIKPTQPAKLNLELLSLQDQVELLQLISITSRTDDEMYGVILSKTKADNDIDQTIEVIQNNNIEFIEPYQQPIIDNSGKTLSEIQNIIQQRLLNNK